MLKRLREYAPLIAKLPVIAFLAAGNFLLVVLAGWFGLGLLGLFALLGFNTHVFSPPDPWMDQSRTGREFEEARRRRFERPARQGRSPWQSAPKEAVEETRFRYIANTISLAVTTLGFGMLMIHG